MSEGKKSALVPQIIVLTSDGDARTAEIIFNWNLSSDICWKIKSLQDLQKGVKVCNFSTEFVNNQAVIFALQVNMLKPCPGQLSSVTEKNGCYLAEHLSSAFFRCVKTHRLKTYAALNIRREAFHCSNDKALCSKSGQLFFRLSLGDARALAAKQRGALKRTHNPKHFWSVGLAS